VKLDILQKSITAFANVLESRDGGLHQYKYDILKGFQEQWTFNTDDFAGMYDRSLQSDVTRRWWKKEHYRPKEMMLLLIQEEEQYVREAFKELLSENKNIENRIDRFGFYGDELLRMYKRKLPRSIENNHYQDSTIVSLYLSGMYPNNYTLYPGRVIFNKALGTLHAQTNTDHDDLPRFFKLSKLIYQYLMKDPAILRIIEKGSRPLGHLLLAHEFMYFAGGVWDEATPA